MNAAQGERSQGHGNKFGSYTVCLTYMLYMIGLFWITDRLIKWTTVRTFQISVYLKAIWGICVPVSAAPASASSPSGPDRYYGRRLLGFASWLPKCCQQRDLHNYRNREEWGIAVLSFPLLNVCVVLLPQFALSHDTSMFNRAIIIHFMCRDTHTLFGTSDLNLSDRCFPGPRF